MDYYQSELTHELPNKEIIQNEAVKQYAAHTVKHIRSHYGWNTQVQINIVPQNYDENKFIVSMKVSGLGEPILVQKSGKHIMALLRKVRKLTMRQIQRISEKKLWCRRKLFFKEKLAA